MEHTVKCTNDSCGRPFNKTFRKCPFCNTPAPTASAPPGPDYTALAEQVVASHGAFLPLEFHPAAVTALDVFFDETWGREGVAPTDAAWDPNKGQRVAIVNLGAFFGDLIRREFGGRWQLDPADPANPWKARVALARANQEVEVAPMTAALNRMRKGTSASFEPTYVQLRTFFERRGTADEADGWVRYARFFAGVARPDLAAPFASRASALGPSAAIRAELDALVAGRSNEGDRQAEAPRAAPATPVREPEAVPAPEASLSPGAAMVRDLLAEAATAFTNGAFDRALATFERVLEIDPPNVGALIGKAGALQSLDRRREALDWLDGFPGRYDCEPARTFLVACIADELDDAVLAHAMFSRARDDRRLSEERRTLASDRVAALANRPEVLLAAVDGVGDLAEAVAAHARISELHPTLARPWCERGVGLVMLGKGDEALACFDRAAALDPTDPVSYDHKAVTLARLRRLDEALVALDAGLRHCPAAGVLHTRRGIFLTQAGRYDEAQRAFDASLRLDPAYTKALAYKGDLEQKTGRPADALASLERFLASKPAGEAKLVKAVRRQVWALKHPGRAFDPERAVRCQTEGLAAVGQGNHAAALRSFDAAIAADPLNGEHWVNRASCLHALGRLGEALAAYRAAEETLDAPSPIVRDGLVSCLVHLDRAGEALECHDRYHDARGKARTLVRLGRCADALPIYQQLVARTPDDRALLIERAEALTAANRPFEASVAYEAARR